jgi:NADPH-dependent 2,4-dienoyl-CoA reductase/sulfur reductase-like enzyme/ferredoxin
VPNAKSSSRAISSVAFPDYTQLSSFMPAWLWQVLRLGSLALTLALTRTLWLQPKLGLPIFWGIAIPLLPLVFFLAPGLWRNLCPLASSNQLPRWLRLSRGWTHKKLWSGAAYPTGLALFFLLVMARKLYIEQSGPATAVLIGGAMAAAFVGGLFFKGKSGWCSTLCPLLPVQRLYGQTPFVAIANTHCKPCVGCTKNCYDFAPLSAALADQYDSSRRYRNYRRFFAGVFPGFVAAYYLVPLDDGLIQLVAQTVIFMIVSLGFLHFAETLLSRLVNAVPVVFAALAFNTYYWFASDSLVRTINKLGWPMDEQGAWAIRLLVFALSWIWIARSLRAEHAFLAEQARQAAVGSIELTEMAADTLRELPAVAVPRLPAPAGATEAVLRIQPANATASLRNGQLLLEAIEGCGVAIETGCRMGVCGADAIAVTQGMDCLAPPGDAERATLERLGCSANTRLACSARVKAAGPMAIDLRPQRAGSIAPSAPAVFDAALKSIVIVGNGIAGLTAAETVRRHHPGCDVHLVSRERHHFYNRIGISRLINGRSAMQGLFLRPESWYAEHSVTEWLNTHVTELRPAANQVILATGDTLAYDRLILAAGSSSWVPLVEGYGMPGTFALRSADEAMAIRDYIQVAQAKSAVVLGAGLLGLEAAHSLRKLGLEVSVLSHMPILMDRQLDAGASTLLRAHLEREGVQSIVSAQVERLLGDAGGRVRGVLLKDGREIAAGVFIACTGVRPNLELCAAAGIATDRGIVVDERMRTSVPGIYAAGDAAQFNGELYGLWPIAMEQGEIAGCNAVGVDKRYAGHVPVTMLKIKGLDLLSIGRPTMQGGDELELSESQPGQMRYRKLVVSRGKLVGAILLGHPDQADRLVELVKRGEDVRAWVGTLQTGGWKRAAPERDAAMASAAGIRAPRCEPRAQRLL